MQTLSEGQLLGGKGSKCHCPAIHRLSAGNFFSAAFEGACATVQGASGGVFGMMGLFIADLVLNFETVKR